MRRAVLGGVTIPLLAHLNSTQEYARQSRETILEMGDASLIKQVYAGAQRKLRTTLSASGPLPPGLDGLDYDQPLLLLCAAEQSITTTLTSVAIPSARRSDAGYEPCARAIVNNEVVQTAVSMAGDTANITPVANAEAYQVLWFPQITVYVENGGPTDQHDIDGAQVGWELSAREV